MPCVCHRTDTADIATTLTDSVNGCSLSTARVSRAFRRVTPASSAAVMAVKGGNLSPIFDAKQLCRGWVSQQRYCLKIGRMLERFK